MGRVKCIIISDKHIFSNAGVREAKICKYHRKFLTVHQGEGALQNRRYVVSRTR